MAKLHHPDTGHFISRSNLVNFYASEELKRRNLPDDESLPPRVFPDEHTEIVDAAWSAVDTIVSL